jgi:hypothetical protein
LQSDLGVVIEDGDLEHRSMASRSSYRYRRIAQGVAVYTSSQAAGSNR